MALENCVVSCSTHWNGESLRVLVENLGGRYSETLDPWCTHVIAPRTNAHRYRVASARYPETPIVHPAWLWACYWNNGKAAPVGPYVTDFFTAARRTGTCTSRGTREQFYTELALFHAVEDRVLTRGIRGRCMANLLLSEYFSVESEHWPFVCRMLQHTVFWGPRVRQVNWDRRCTLLMCLQHATQAPRRRVQCGRGGPVPVLRRVAMLPRDLWRLVVRFC